MCGLVFGSLLAAMLVVSTDASTKAGRSAEIRSRPGPAGLAETLPREHPKFEVAAQKTRGPREVEKPRRDVPTKGKVARLKDVRPRFTLVGHHSDISDLAFSPDGKFLASSGDGEEPVRLWDVTTGKGREAFRPGLSGGYPVHLAFSPDGKILASGGLNLKEYERLDQIHRVVVHLWETSSGKDRFVVASNSKNPNIHSLAYSPDGNTLVVNNGRCLYLWDVMKETSRAELELPADTRFSGINTAYFTRAVISPDGRTLATSGLDRQVRLWDTATGRPLARFQAHGRGVNVVAFSKDGARLVSAGADKTVRVWLVTEIQERKSAARPERILEQNSGIYDLALSADGTLLATAGFDGVVTIHDAKTWKLRTSFDTGMDYCSLCAFSPDGSILATSGSLPEIRIWDVAALLAAATDPG